MVRLYERDFVEMLDEVEQMWTYIICIIVYTKNAVYKNSIFFGCAQHGRQLDGENPLWGLVVATISRRQGCPS